ncbi:MAG: S9 family peptidase, partial [Gammaproteobacteria bacterium]
DPNTLSSDGTVALSGTEANRDGRLLAYGLSRAGSDWQEWHVRDVDSGQDLAECLEWVKFSSISWTPDGKGFFYCRYDAPKSGDEFEGQNHFHKLYFHRIGTSQDEDELIYARHDQRE